MHRGASGGRRRALFRMGHGEPSQQRRENVDAVISLYQTDPNTPAPCIRRR